ncbi:sigma 54-interacting transcriptional regulator, partial [Azospirillum sp. B4]|uniref:sigma 54-interacting transcriptional regulator n=1 Tax=Azospirillum sp. B4 TaxID=95605 RepID=UPI0011DE5656
QMEKVDVRFISATNRDPLAEVGAGRFREDLYYRLHVVPIHLPPLREREEDVCLIARHFLADMAKEEGKSFVRLDPDAESALKAYDFPGNVRQLQNILRNVVVLNDGPVVTRAMLPEPLRPEPVCPEPGSAVFRSISPGFHVLAYGVTAS